MVSDAQKLANIRMMLDHFGKVDDHFEVPNCRDEVPLLVEWLSRLLNGESYDWKEFTVDVATTQYYEGALFGSQLEEYKKAIGYK